MKKITIETKTNIEVEITTPSYRKSNEKFLDCYLYFTNESVIEVTPNAIFMTNCSKHNDTSTAQSFFNSYEVSKDEFMDFYNATITKINSKL